MAEIQQALVLIKPDGLVKSLTGNIITALSETKLKIVGAKITKVSKQLAEAHYAELKHKKGEKIFNSTVEFLTGKFHTDRTMALVYEGEDAIRKIREEAGATNPEDASPVSIRGKYGRINSRTGVFENCVHVSDSPENAKKEIQLWFKPSELVSNIYPVKKQKSKSEELVWA